MNQDADTNKEQQKRSHRRTESGKALWHVELLGPLRLVRDGQVQETLGTQKTAVLLAWLALHPNLQPRERVLDRLWPDRELSAARNNLSTILVSLRKLLEPQGVPRGSVLVATPTEIGLDSDQVTTDVALLEGLLKQAAHTAEAAQRAARLARATALYQGEILPGSYQNWAIRESERLQARVEEALTQLASDREALGDLNGALEAVQRCLLLDPYSEEMHCRQVQLYVLTGHIKPARDAHQRFLQLLRQEFGATPTPETEQCVAQWLAHRPLFPSPPTPAAGKASPLPIAPPPPAPPLQERTSGIQEEPGRDLLSRDHRSPTRLPVVLSRFMGREEELMQLARWLLPYKSTASLGEEHPPCRLVTLTGSGGIGKTRLAIEFARQVSARLLSWCGFVSLAELTSAEQMVAHLNAALAAAPAPDAPAFEQLVSFLQQQDRPQAPPLLILDNLEHLLGEESTPVAATHPAGLVQMLQERVPGLLLVCTSRRRLGVRGERIVPIAPLPVPEPPGEHSDVQMLPTWEANISVRLYLDRAQAVRPDFSLTPTNGAAVAALCRQLEGSPLALELAAAWVRVLPPRKMWERLTQGLDIPPGSYRDLPTRHRNLSAVMDWSYRLLTPGQQRLFGRLSVFQGGWTAESAAEICEESEVLLLLAQLLDASLIRIETLEEGEEVRYGFAESVRTFSRERLKEQGETDNFQHRHGLFFLKLAETFASTSDETVHLTLLVRLEAERENLREAIFWFRQQTGYAEQALRLPSILLPYWEKRGYAAEGLEHLQAALALPQTQRLTQVRGAALGTASALALYLSDYPLAAALQRQALALWEHMDHVRGQASALHNLANVVLQQGDYLEAEALYLRALAINRETGNLPWQALNLTGVAELKAKRGAYPEAIADFEASLHLALQSGDRYSEGVALTNMARVYLQARDLEKAEAYARQALELAQKSGNRMMEPYLYFCLGEASRLQGDLATAETWLRRSIGGSWKQGNRREVFTGLKSLAALRTEQGQAAQAARLYGYIARLRAGIQAILEPTEQAEYDRQLTDARAQLSAQEFHACYIAGEQMTWEELEI